MKPEGPEVQDDESGNPTPVAGDAIGDTAYSERFVLKILLKFANLDTLKLEITEKSFEDDLCTLWDMTTESDVVSFLQKHEVLNLFNFALPVIETPRIIEIIVGIIGNMCCRKEVVTVLLKLDSFLTFLMEYIKTDDSLILVQVIRLINCSLYVADEDDLSVWMNLFINTGYANALYYILKNSSNKDLLVTALENFNTICSYFNTEKFRTNFFIQFVTIEAVESLSSAFTEVTVNQKDMYVKDELERLLVISLQIILNLVGFDKSLEVLSTSKEEVTKMISYVISYYENKLVHQKEIDTDFVDIIDSTNTIVGILRLSETCEPDKYFMQSYSMWKASRSLTVSDQNGSNFEEDDKEELQHFSKQMLSPLSTLICVYMDKCSENNLLRVLDDIGTDYEYILSSVKNKELQTSVSKRAANYRSRLKENVDS